MTRLLTEGFEMGDYVGWVLSGSSGYHSISTTQKRSGAYSEMGSSNLVGSGTLYYDFGVSSECFIRFGVYLDLHSASTKDDIQIRWFYGGTMLGGLYLKPGTVIDLMNSAGTILKSGVNVLSQGVWYLIEVHVIIATAGKVEIKLEGVIQPELTYTGDTQPGTAEGVSRLGIFCGCHTSVNTRFYVDDIAVNDTNGSVDNSWCGDGRVIAVMPNGTITNQLVGSDGDSVNNHLHVDERSSDGDTSYVQGTVVDEEDLYDFAACGLASTCTIPRIWAEARTKNTVALGRKVALITKANGGSEVVGPDIPLSTSYDTRVKSTEELINPVTVLPWTIADLDALQAGVRTRS